jgi:hypothetical protein
MKPSGCLAPLILLAGLAHAVGPAHYRACKEQIFAGTVEGGQEFSHPITPNLTVVLRPLKSNRGWTLVVYPRDSSEQWQDWTYPVNLPIRTGETQLLGTGYGSTVQEELSQPHSIRSIRFVLNQSDFNKYSKMANDALDSPDPFAAGKFIAAMKKAHTGNVLFTTTDYRSGGSPEMVKSIDFRITVTVPIDFPTDGNVWQPAPCPDPR